MPRIKRGVRERRMRYLLSMAAHELTPGNVAKVLRVSLRSAYRWWSEALEAHRAHGRIELARSMGGASQCAAELREGGAR